MDPTMHSKVGCRAAYGDSKVGCRTTYSDGKVGCRTTYSDGKVVAVACPQYIHIVPLSPLP